MLKHIGRLSLTKYLSQQRDVELLRRIDHWHRLAEDYKTVADRLYNDDSAIGTNLDLITRQYRDHAAERSDIYAEWAHFLQTGRIATHEEDAPWADDLELMGAKQ
jgi:hypothetical protein